MVTGKAWKSGPAGRGFTLVEIMMAVLILGIVLGTLYAAWTGTLRVAREGEKLDKSYAMARVVMNQLSEDLESLAPWDGEFVFQGGPQEAWKDSFTKLRFVSSRRLGLAGISGGLSDITWFGVEDLDGDGWMLMRRECLCREYGENDMFHRPFDDENAHIVAEGLRSFRCRFFERQGEAHPEWNSQSDTRNHRGTAPPVVSIRLEFDDPCDSEGVRVFTTKVFIPRAAGGGS
ncbi:MAG TPA: type II secretion system protein [Deltaproteobacteria bacterium]|nr:type II secretion system protein [Deltaproteobacteria bacterium]